MIKAEVAFSNHRIVLNGFEIDVDFDSLEYDVCLVDGGFVSSFNTLEQAIAYCLEQINANP